MKKFMSIPIIGLVFVFLACLPVIPISTAPVILNATYTIRWKTFFNILRFIFNRPDGLSFQWHWFTYVAIFILMSIACLISVFVLRKLGDTSNN